MSAATLSDLTIRQALARIDRAQAETRKLLAEQGRMERERAALLFQAMISGMAVGGALVAGTVALMRVVGG